MGWSNRPKNNCTSPKNAVFYWLKLQNKYDKYKASKKDRPFYSEQYTFSKHY